MALILLEVSPFFFTGLMPKSAIAQRLATMCVLPLLLAGILGHPSKKDNLTVYLRNLLIQRSREDSQSAKHEIINSVRFIWYVSPQAVADYRAIFFIVNPWDFCGAVPLKRTAV